MKKGKNLKLIPFFTENVGKENSFTICVDANSNDIYKVEDQEINPAYFILLFFLVFVFIRMFPLDLIPFNKVFLFIPICLIIWTVCIVLGYYMRVKLVTNIKQISVHEQMWEEYHKKYTYFYRRRVVLSIVLLLISVCFFVLLYIYPSKSWLFGGIFSSLFAGSQIILLSRTGYLLYKNKLVVNLNNREKENQDITEW